MNRLTRQIPTLLAAAVLLSFLPTGCGTKNVASKGPDAGNVEPDKVLYDRALNDYEHGRYTEARLSLQALINSYPDSEYLAKAKLAVADSYFKQGGVDGMTQAVAEYKDYITFFPFLDDAAYAQMQVGMAHYRMMEKADRDSTQAELAEQEFQTFLLKYPKSNLAPEAEQRLREVQEILAAGDFDVARFYYLKGDYRASGARLTEVIGRYPLFSEADRATWMLGDIYRRAARGSKNEQERVRWRTASDVAYANLVKNYPLSPFAADAKRQLTEDGVKIPSPDPQALARAQYEAKFERDHPGIFHRALGVVKSSPDVSAAARTGEPDLNPPGEMNGSQDVLQANANASSNVAVGSATDASSGGTSGGTATATAETVPATESSSNAGGATISEVDPPTATTVGAAPTGNTTASIPDPGAKHPQTETDLNAAEELKANPPSAATKKAPSKPKASSASKSKAKKQKTPKADKKTESTSKKKKGLHKILPF
jgi:outer membrane protein assembly factor BamD